jgi:biotin carboxyl carrier protein
MKDASGEYRIVVGGSDGEQTEPAMGWRLQWLDGPAGIARLVDDHRAISVVVEGGGTEWYVTLRGRRIPVSVRSRREQLLAEAAMASAASGAPVELKASLPGLIAAVEIVEGSEVAAGDALLIIEAMKMQNEVRAPRAGRVTSLLVKSGQAVATGQVLLRLE